MANSVRITEGTVATKIPLGQKDFEKILALSLKHLAGTREYEALKKVVGPPKYVELHFCNDAEMRAFQKNFRQLDRTTDVLSFPAVETPAHSEKSFLGSIVIALPTVRRNALRYRREERAELVDVFIHGILHLFAFDHVRVSPRKKERMRAVQKAIFLSVQRAI